MSRSSPYYFKADEEQVFLKACEESTRDHCIFKTFFDSGMTISELVGDKRTGYRGVYVEDIDFDDQEVRVFGKGQKERVVDVSREALEEILKWLGGRRSGKVFDITPRMVQKLARKYSKKAGLPDFFRCKKCGQRQIPENMKACPKCGNTKLMLESRWSPHKARHTHITKIIYKTGDIAAALEQTGLKSLSIPITKSPDDKKSVMQKVFGES